MFVILSGVKQLFRGQRTVFKLKFVDENDAELAPVDVVTLTGYEIAVTGSAVTDTDTLLEAIGKLEARIVELETP